MGPSASGPGALGRRRLVLFMTSGMSLEAWRAGGTLERELALYRRLAPELAGVSVVSYGGRREAALARGAGVEVTANRLGLPQRLYMPWLERLWRPPRRAILKSNQVPGGQVALAVARRRRLPFLCRLGYPYSLNVEAAQGDGSEQARQARLLEEQVFAGADLIAVSAGYMAEAYQERYGLPAERFRVVPNYVDTELFSPGAAEEAELPRVGFVGRLGPEKNLAALVEAVAGLEAELWLIGAGPEEAGLRERAERLGARVRFWGRRPHAQLPELLGRCRVFVLPSFYEGQPKVLLEAMSLGLAVVGTEVRGIRQVIRHRETGLLCGTGAEQLRGAVSRLLEDAALRRRLGRAAREQVVAAHSLEKVAAAELAVLRELA